MKDEQPSKEIQAILDAFDEAIKDGPWDSSNFLRAIGHQLQELKASIENQFESPSSQQTKITSHIANRIALRKGQLEVFVSLYCADGANLQAWERLIASVPKQIISRPIYINEEDVKAMISSKPNKLNDAYLSVFIQQQDILTLSAEKAPKDKLGHSLLTLKTNVILPENMSRFVHTTGLYKVEQGRLVKV